MSRYTGRGLEGAVEQSIIERRRTVLRDIAAALEAWRAAVDEAAASGRARGLGPPFTAAEDAAIRRLEELMKRYADQVQDGAGGA